jgi:hypothetical protein
MISNSLDAEMTQYAVDMSILALIYYSRPVVGIQNIVTT